MAPDVEELIKRVNTLTLDKNRLKQKLTQLSNDQKYGKDAISKLNQWKQQNSLDALDAACETRNSLESITQESFTFSETLPDKALLANEITSSGSKLPPTKANKSPLQPQNKTHCKVISDVECATSCEDDILFMNELFIKRLEEYNENWNFIQSKCSSLLSELNALQARHARLILEKLELEEKYNLKCKDCDDIKGELQTVVLNYEAQLSAMSEHLSTITGQIS